MISFDLTHLLYLGLMTQFRALDRETNTTLVLLAAPFRTGELYFVASRAVRRDGFLKPTNMKKLRSAFAEIVSRQQAPRPTPLFEQLPRAFLSSHGGSSSGAREEDLLRALDTAIGSFHALTSLYKRRETRWIEEKLKLDEYKQKIQLLLKQALGIGVFDNLAGSLGDLTARPVRPVLTLTLTLPFILVLFYLFVYF